MTSLRRLLCTVMTMMVVMVVNGQDHVMAEGDGMVVREAPPTPTPPKTSPVEIASPPQLPLLQPTPPQPPPPPPPPADPLPGLFVRQETAIRKVDGLIAKMGKLDDLDTKIDRLSSILQAREDQLEAMLEKVAGRVDAVEKKLVVMAGKGDELSEKVEDVFDVVTLLDNKVDILGVDMKEVDERVMDVREVVEEVRMEMNASLENRGSDKVGKEGPQHNTIPTASTPSPPHEDIHLILSNLTRLVEESLEENGVSARECQDAVTHLEEVLNPFINTSHHLAASVVNRIRASNLAMDKRLGAVLHALSLRHHLLGDGLHKAISTVNSHVALLLQQHLKTVEDKVEEVEELVRSSADELYVAFNSISSTSSSTSMFTSPSTALSPPLLDTLDSILHLSNLTLHHLLQDKQEEEGQEEEEEKEEEEKEEEETVEGNELNGEKEAAMCVLVEESNNSTTTSSTTSNTITNTTSIPATFPPSSMTATDLQDAVREALRERLTHLEEQVSGLRIYLSTSLHVHAGQVEERVALVEAGLLRVVRETLSKSNRGLEKLRRASLGYLDAAVTSVSSAAVASAQATADHLSRTLTEVALMLARRMYRVEVAVRAAMGGGDGGDDGNGGSERVGWQRWWWWWWCPAMAAADSEGVPGGGGGGGGGVCLSALPGNASSWGAAREHCRGVGGDLLTFPPTNTPLHPFLQQGTLHPPHLSSTPPLIPFFWVGGQRVMGVWKWITGELVEGEVEEEEDGAGGDCLVVAVGEGGDVKMAASSCPTQHPALCQLSGHPGNDPGPPLDPHHNEVTPIASNYYLTPDDLILI